MKNSLHRSGSRTDATSNMEGFVIIVNGFQSLTIITKRSILDVAAVLDPTLLPSFEVANDKVIEVIGLKPKKNKRKATSW